MNSTSLASLPTSLTKSASNVSIGPSGSGSFQSHLSTTNSQQRLRATCSYVSPPKDPLSYDSYPKGHSYTLSQSTRTITSFIHALLPSQVARPIDDRSLSLRSWPTVWLKCAALVYCCLSLVFMSGAAYKRIHEKDLHSLSTLKPQEPPNTSSLDALSTQQRLSRISSLQPPLKGFDPFLLRGEAHLDTKAVTACLWSNDNEISDRLPSWAALWPGPISLLMTTTAPPSSTQHESLLERLQALKTYPPLSSLSLHLLHVNSQTQDSPNTYLNLARLFASTSSVMLFPGNFSVLPPSTFYGIISESAHSAHRPMIITSGDQVSFPVLALSPIVIRRDYPLWCIERFFFSSSRTAHWEECIWQLWLESFGAVGHIIATTAGLQGEGEIVSAISEKFRNRLSIKYRTETCELAAKMLATIEQPNSRSGKRKFQWLKRFCGQGSIGDQVEEFPVMVKAKR